MNNALFPDLVVNGETVPHAEIAAETQNQQGPKGKPGIVWRKAANAVAIRTLLLQEARARRVSTTPEELGPGRLETSEEALIRGLLEQAVEIPEPSEDDIRAEWQKDPDRFRTAPLWEVSHILCACDPREGDALGAAKTRALGLLKTVRADPKGFADLAGRVSDCGSKASGGALGQVGPGDTVPEFEAALKTLSDGEIAPDPVVTRHGVHIIRMDAVAKGQVLPFETVRPHIAQAIEKARWVQGAHAFVRQLAASAEVTGADLQPV